MTTFKALEGQPDSKRPYRTTNDVSGSSRVKSSMHWSLRNGLRKENVNAGRRKRTFDTESCDVAKKSDTGPSRGKKSKLSATISPFGDTPSAFSTFPKQVLETSGTSHITKKRSSARPFKMIAGQKRTNDASIVNRRSSFSTTLDEILHSKTSSIVTRSVKQKGAGKGEARHWQTSRLLDTDSPPIQDATDRGASQRLQLAGTGATTELNLVGISKRASVDKQRKTDGTSRSYSSQRRRRSTARTLVQTGDEGQRCDEVTLASGDQYMDRRLYCGPTSQATAEAKHDVTEFHLAEGMSILTLVEGITTFRTQEKPVESSVISPSRSLQDYRRKIVQKRLPLECPDTGILQSLPNVCFSGGWQAQIVPEDGCRATLAKNMENGEIAKLHEYRICLRHSSHLEMGPLSEESGSNGNMVVSTFYPSKERLQNVPDMDGAFIGSISLVGNKEFVSSREIVSEKRSLVCGVLQSMRILTTSKGEVTEDDYVYPMLLQVTKMDESGPKVIGVSIMCGLQLDSNYHLVFARDEGDDCSPVVAVDVVFANNDRADVASPVFNSDFKRTNKTKSTAKPLFKENLSKLTTTIGSLSPMESLGSFTLPTTTLFEDRKSQPFVPLKEVNGSAGAEKRTDGISDEGSFSRESHESCTMRYPTQNSSLLSFPLDKRTLRHKRASLEEKLEFETQNGSRASKLGKDSPKSSILFPKKIPMKVKYQAKSKKLDMKHRAARSQGPRRVSHEPPKLLATKKKNARTSSYQISKTDTGSLFDHSPVIQSFDSWSDDWEGSSLDDHESETLGVSLGKEEVQSGRSSVWVEPGDMKRDSVSYTHQTVSPPPRPKSGLHVCLRKRIIRRMMSIIALVLVGGLHRPIRMPSHGDIFTLTRRYKNTLPPPIRLINANPPLFRPKSMTK